MDIGNINPIVSGTNQAYKPQVATQPVNTDPVPVTQQQQPNITIAANNNSTPSVQEQYEAAIRQASLSFKNSYPLGDTEFSLFKDATGQIITRYVNLRDGSVTYVPAPVFTVRNSIVNPPIVA